MVYRGKVCWVRAIEVPGWVPNFEEDCEDEYESNDGAPNDEGLGRNFEKFKDLEGKSDIEEVSETRFEDEPVHNIGEDNSVRGRQNKSEDLFGLYELLNKKKVVSNNVGESQTSPTYPPGFTPNDVGVTNVDESNVVNFLSLQETKMEVIDLWGIKRCWGNLAFDYVYSEAVGTVMSDYFVMVRGVWVLSGKSLLIISIYAPQELSEKRMLWDYLRLAICNWDGDVVEVPLGGCSFTWCHKSASKMSKLDRFLISDSLLCACPSISSVSLDRYLSDHRPILMRESHYDYGLTPFKFYHYWFEFDGFDKFVEDSWKEILIDKGDGVEKDVHRRHEILRNIQDLKKTEAMEAAQKAKIKWVASLSTWKAWFLKKRLKERCGIVVLINLPVWMDLRSVFIGVIGISLRATFLMLSHGFSIMAESRMEFIGSVYKIVAKILANRLVMVLGDLVSDTQYAFVKDRQILDGPFILNELVQWCKKKRKQSMIFKVDFEKAYDSVRWDFIDTILKKFRFGDKWCNWIGSCLQSSRGSVLVNGSPTSEFQFFKGLKQGDPLSPFLFNLVMESLHVLFQRVVDAGLFTGIMLDTSISVTHLFYDDDAIFMGQWNQANIDTITRSLLKWEHAVERYGFLECMVARLSKWKLKTISIGGRLTLLKSVLADAKSRKSCWVSWKKVMASKDTGGLGVASLFTLNRALMFKWVWRFITQKKSLWTRVIKAIYDDDGKIGKKFHLAEMWCWYYNTYYGMSLGGGDVALKIECLDYHMLENMKSRSGAKKLSMRTRMEFRHRWTWSLEGSGDFSVSSVRKVIDAVYLPRGSVKTRWIKEIMVDRLDTCYSPANSVIRSCARL
ncbi:RNA-directed DNA polymerase, eukaryota, reverse transcriptase zinc-binding domain protein [Tanacetum coccineum]